MSSLRLFLIFSYIFLFTVSAAHPMFYGNAAVYDSLGEARQIAKRTLASGRWGLRPGKRSMIVEPNYDYDPPQQLHQLSQQQQVFTDPSSQAIYHLWLLA